MTQLLRALSNTPIQVDITFLMLSSHVSKNTSASHLNKFYVTFEEIKKKKFDGMIITGAPVENLEFIRKGISENGNTQVKTIVFPGLNHMFQPAVTGSPVEYSDIEETIAPAVLQEIVNWLNQLK